MARYYPFARSPAACLLAAVFCVGCMQSPQVAARTSASQSIALQTAERHCQNQPSDAEWQAVEQELRVQGLTLQVQCAGTRPQGGLQLVVHDSVRASAVLRGPLADGEPVELGADAQASPDVQFNRAWLDHALLRHSVQRAEAGEARASRSGPQPQDLATR